MKLFDVCGMGSALVDILVDVSEERVSELGFKKGSMVLTSAEEQKALLALVDDGKAKIVSGGSVANSVVAISQLGGKSALINRIGQDKYGAIYVEESESQGVSIVNEPIPGEITGTCVSLITPDSERTMRTCLATAALLDPNSIKEEAISISEWLFIEGYLFANGQQALAAISKAVSIAKSSATKIAVTCSEPWVISAFSAQIKEVISQSDLIFANEHEARALTETESAEHAFEKLAADLKNVVVTDGPNGAYVAWNGDRFHTPAFACTPRDLTGAGDMFAGSFLYGVTRGEDPRKVVRGSCFLAKEVITRIGARLPEGARSYWDQSFAS